MYRIRQNVWPDGPGHWVTADGEYSFTHTADGWQANRLDAHLWGLDSLIGTTRTLDAALATAARHYTTPLGQWKDS